MKYDYFSIENREAESKGGTLPRHIIKIHSGPQDSTGKQIFEIRVKIETLKKVSGDSLYYRSVVENSTDTGILIGAEY